MALRIRHNAFVFLSLAVCSLGCNTTSGTATVNLQKRLEEVAKTAHGKVGVAMELLETKETFWVHGQRRFPMQSVYKLPIAIAVLDQVDQGALKLDQLIRVETNDFVTASQHSPIRDAFPFGTDLTVSNLVRQMVSGSDGTACDVLLRLLNGPSSVDSYLHQLGITNVKVVTTEKEMGRDELIQYQNWATPEGMITLLRKFHEGHGLSRSSRELLLQFLTETTTGARRIKGLLPPGTGVAHKTGSSQAVNGLAAATNDAGIITLPDGRHILIAVFVSDSTADLLTREAVIANVAREAWDYWLRSK